MTMSPAAEQWLESRALSLEVAATIGVLHRSARGRMAMTSTSCPTPTATSSSSRSARVAKRSPRNTAAGPRADGIQGLLAAQGRPQDVLQRGHPR